MKFGGLFCDYDGVLVDLNEGCQATIGHPIHHLPQKEWAIQYNKNCNSVGFWANLPPMPDFGTLWGYIKYWSPSILTAYPQSSTDSHIVATKGKWEWNKKHTMVPESRFHCVQRQDKAKYAMSNGQPNVLIDDHEENIKEWDKAGGTGIHHTSAVSTIIQLKRLGFKK